MTDFDVQAAREALARVAQTTEFANDVRILRLAIERASGSVTEAKVEAAARSLASLEPGEGWPSNESLGGNPTGTRDDEYRDGLRDMARAALEAAQGV